ncbi:hypothetical protein BH09ACT8_BH09ACT8_14590 [soil metagenome]
MGYVCHIANIPPAVSPPLEALVTTGSTDGHLDPFRW